MKKSITLVSCALLCFQAQSQDFFGGALQILNEAVSNAQKINQQSKQPVTPPQELPQKNSEAEQKQTSGKVSIFKTAPPIDRWAQTERDAFFRNKVEMAAFVKGGGTAVMSFYQNKNSDEKLANSFSYIIQEYGGRILGPTDQEYTSCRFLFNRGIIEVLQAVNKLRLNTLSNIPPTFYKEPDRSLSATANSSIESLKEQMKISRNARSDEDRDCISAAESVEPVIVDYVKFLDIYLDTRRDQAKLTYASMLEKQKDEKERLERESQARQAEINADKQRIEAEKKAEYQRQIDLERAKIEAENKRIMEQKQTKKTNQIGG